MAASLRLSATLALALRVRGSDPHTHERQRPTHTPSLSEPRTRTGPPNTSPHSRTIKTRRKGENSQAARKAARTRPSTHLQTQQIRTRAMPQQPPAYEVGSDDNFSTKQRHEDAMIFRHPAAGCVFTFRPDKLLGFFFDMYGP